MPIPINKSPCGFTLPMSIFTSHLKSNPRIAVTISIDVSWPASPQALIPSGTCFGLKRLQGTRPNKSLIVFGEPLLKCPAQPHWCMKAMLLKGPRHDLRQRAHSIGRGTMPHGYVIRRVR